MTHLLYGDLVKSRNQKGGVLSVSTNLPDDLDFNEQG